jgi:hypothetical protein
MCCCDFECLDSVLDPDQHGSAFIWLSWIRIRIGNADPDSGIYHILQIDLVLYKSLSKMLCTFVGTFFNILPSLSIFFM